MAVMQGWLMSSNPGSDPGDTTAWHASFWEFCGAYCEHRFGSRWHLSPEQSLLLCAENSVIPTQTIIYTPEGKNNTLGLLFGTSLYDLKQKQTLLAKDIVIRDGLRLYSPSSALIKVPDSFFARYPVEAQVALSGIRDASGILALLLDGGHSVIAGRLTGAFKHVGRGDIAREISAAMKSAGYDVRQSDPFVPSHKLGMLPATASPIAGRIQAMWTAMREAVTEVFPPAPGLPKNKTAYMKFVDEIYQTDAYHSLSIEGYRVTPELIERVKSGDWNSKEEIGDRQGRDALAAKGYWQAFQLVKEAIERIISAEPAGPLVADSHQDWYRQMFQPCVAVGLIAPLELAGYRSNPVYLKGSLHVPPRREAVLDAMPALFEQLSKEAEPSVRAVLGHLLFGYIHPYPDGNGRMARFLMNAMLASGGYPWTVIRIEDRSAYMEALESASVDMDIRPLAKFIAQSIELPQTVGAIIRH